MKKLVLITLIGLLVFTGCDDSNSNNAKEEEIIDNQEEQINEAQDDNGIMDEYSTILKATEEPKEVVEFVDMNIGNLETKNANKMALKLSEYLTQFYGYNSQYWGTFESLSKYYEYPAGIEPDKIKETDLREFYDNLMDTGYKLEMMEGMVNPIVDYRWMSKYDAYLSEDITDFFSLCALESDELCAKDAGLVISWDELGKRAIAAEVYLSKYSESQAADNALGRYKEYLRMYMLGLSNTSVADYQSNKVIDEVLQSYNKLIKENEGTATAEAIENYIQILEEMDYILPYNDQKAWDDFNTQLEELIINASSYN